jgi:nicotinamidase/pyrazinamidase
MARLRFKKALLVVDLQNDFCAGGALAVSGAEKIIPNLNRYIKLFCKKGLPIFASRDWHPRRTSHFKRYGGLWPFHCVQNTKGAMFHSHLKLPRETIVISKGMQPDQDSYSVFDGFDSRGVTFSNLLEIFAIKELYVGGLATDYCVKFSVIGALKAGFKVMLLTDAIKGVDKNKGDCQYAIKEMLRCGARKMTLNEVSL